MADTEAKTRQKAITAEDAFPQEHRALLVMATEDERKEIVASAYRERERSRLAARAAQLKLDAAEVQSKADEIEPDQRTQIALSIAERMLKAASGVKK